MRDPASAIGNVTIIDGATRIMKLARARALEYSNSSFEYLLRKPLSKPQLRRLETMIAKTDVARDELCSSDQTVVAAAIRQHPTLLFTVAGCKLFGARKAQSVWYFLRDEPVIHSFILDLPAGTAAVPDGFREFCSYIAYILEKPPVVR